MAIPHPSHFRAELTEDRLAMVAGFLLDELHKTETDLSRDEDDGYTRGCATFGRQKNRISRESRSGSHDWLSLANSTNDLVFNIGGVPCRFSNDDPDSPRKLAVLAANRYQAPLFEETKSGDPCRFCFVIDRGISESAEARVVFMGFDATGELRCQWVSDSIRTMYSVAPNIPAPVEISKPVVSPKKQDSGKGEAARSS